MPGKLDEISRVIGNQESNLKGLKETFQDHCRDDDRRHDENQKVLKEICAGMTELRDAVRPLTGAVNAMKPIVDGYQITRWKFMGALALASFLLAGIGWLVSLLFGKAVAWIFSLLLVGKA